MGIQTSFYGIIFTIVSVISVSVGTLISVSPEQFSFLTTLGGSILVDYGILKYILQPLFQFISNALFKEVSENKIITKKRTHRFPPKRKKR
ncbi:hypothetical protein [Vagococcus hydrophili]